MAIFEAIDTKTNSVIVGGPHAGQLHDRYDSSDAAVLILPDPETGKPCRYKLVVSGPRYHWAFDPSGG